MRFAVKNPRTELSWDGPLLHRLLAIVGLEINSTPATHTRSRQNRFSPVDRERLLNFVCLLLQSRQTDLARLLPGRGFCCVVQWTEPVLTFTGRRRFRLD